MILYFHINDIFVAHLGTHAAAFGTGEKISLGIYSIVGTGSVVGSITLNEEGNTDAVFIIKYLGAITIGATSRVILINETRTANVYWITKGAISVGAGSILKGPLFSHGGNFPCYKLRFRRANAFHRKRANSRSSWRRYRS